MVSASTLLLNKSTSETSMMIFSVMTKITSAQGAPIGFALELPFDDVASVCDALSGGEFISGNKLVYTDDGRGGKLITGREQFGINPDQISTITPAKYRFWEPDVSVASGAQSPLSAGRHPVSAPRAA